jgi:hypothetical protein
MVEFKKIQHDTPINELINSTFSVDFLISGGWGYTKNSATIVLGTDMPLSQLQHTLASMRTYLEMNLTPPKEERFGSINLVEAHRQSVTKNYLCCEKVTYAVTAIKEDIYTQFINQYKEGYGKEGFNIEEHFNRRKEATLKREVDYWFEVSKR